MKRTGIDHPKLRMLASLLGIPTSFAIGIMECLYHFTAKHTPCGNLGKWPDNEIAHAAYWPTDDSERLIGALVSAKLLDVHEEHRLVVHDWPEHCEDSVHMALARKRERFADGTIPNLVRFAKDERSQILSDYEAQAHKKHTKSTRRVHKKPTVESSLPGPALALAKPCPAMPEPSPALAACAGDAGEGDPSDEPTADEFLDAWNSAEGNTKARDFTASRLKHFRARIRDPVWRDAWRRALDKFPLKLTVGNPDGWKPDLDWFLRPDSVTRILEGKYDWSKTDGKQPNRAGDGQRYNQGSSLGRV